MKKEVIYSIKHSFPIFISFIPVGIVYGILMGIKGYNWVWTAICSVGVYAGSLQYLMIDFFAENLPFIEMALMALLLNSRHIFYGIPFVNKWRKYGKDEFFLIFALTDEAFSMHISNRLENGENEKLVCILCSLFAWIYWIVLSILGSVIGNMISFNTDGMDFALTALFIVIVIEQIKKTGKNKLPIAISAGSSMLCMLIFGTDFFIFPSLLITILILLLIRKKIEVMSND